MRVVGMEAVAQETWEKMGLINRAHIRAGMVLKRRLTYALRQHSGLELLSSGRLDVDVPGIDSGSLSAIRIDVISQRLHVKDADLFRLVAPWQK
jgi:hypothetical protein